LAIGSQSLLSDRPIREYSPVRMAIYVVVVDSAELAAPNLARLEELYPNHKKLAPNVWALKTNELTKKISEDIFLLGEDGKPLPGAPPVTRHVVVRIDAYWGFHDRTLWEWLSIKEAESNE